MAHRGALLERRGRWGVGAGVAAEVVTGFHRVAGWHSHGRSQPAQRVFVGGPHLRDRQPQAVGDPGEHPVGRVVVDGVGGRGAPGSANSASLVHSGRPSVRQYSAICQRGNGSPGYHLP